MEKDYVKVGPVKVAVDRQRLSQKILNVLERGEYEMAEAHQIPAIVQQGDRIVELGGGLGFLSSLCALQKKATRIAVYEANPALIPLIKRTHSLNGVEADVVNAVVLPRKDSETVPFFIRDDFWASSLSGDIYGYREKVEVPVVSLADVLRRYEPTMLVVDIEGGEVDLFNDVPLTGVEKVYIEVHQNIIGRVGMKRLFDFFSSRDFHYDQWHSQHGVILFSHVLR